ncbi:MAG: 50S ribosomal protein L11 methyltransferase [Crocinitomicaceae bacterium]|nr:50S ribosomal protein L11 methyltransferase [Crocinitomicaceae bacterium]
MDYLELTVNLTPREPWAEILVAQLAEFGFESFVDTETGVQAYGQVAEVNMADVKSETLLSGESEAVKVDFSEKIIPQQNWNALWEADFQPVDVDGRMTILAPFHSKEEAKGMLIEIQPQMSFGTGHHQTTWMMSKALLDLDQVPAKILDMGTGTGVLAILAEKLGAEEIVAIDIEDWSVENTQENAVRNACTKITALCGDVDLIEDQQFDMILANINKNILKRHLQAYSEALVTGGKLYLSGFFETDADELIELGNTLKLKHDHTMNKETWAALCLVKQP